MAFRTPFGSLLLAAPIDNFNLKWHFGAMQKISMLEIRRNARGLVERLRRGESFTITYRNQPVGELRPVAEVTAVVELSISGMT